MYDNVLHQTDGIVRRRIAAVRLLEWWHRWQLWRFQWIPTMTPCRRCVDKTLSVLREHEKNALWHRRGGLPLPNSSRLQHARRMQDVCSRLKWRIIILGSLQTSRAQTRASRRVRARARDFLQRASDEVQRSGWAETPRHEERVIIQYSPSPHGGFAAMPGLFSIRCTECIAQSCHTNLITVAWRKR